NHFGLTSNAQRRTSNAQYRFGLQHSMLDVERSALLFIIFRRPSASARASPVPPLISLRLFAAIRGRPCAHRLACSRAQLTRAPPRSLVPAPAWARVTRSPLPMQPPRRVCPSVQEQFAQLF